MDQVTFADVLQKSFVAMSMGGTDRITTINILANILMSFAVGMFIFYIYRKTFQGVLYQRSFNISLVLASVVTSIVIMTISGNLILSLGMVGALSIVRFRTPIKDSIDLIFMFWAISVGIANGVGYYNIAIVGSIALAILLLVMTSWKRSQSDAFLVVLQFPEASGEKEIMEAFKQKVAEFSVKSKVVSDAGVELTLEARIRGGDTEFLSDMKRDNLIQRATLVAYDQDLSAA